MTYTSALITIAIFLLGHLIAAIWWASHVNTVLTGLTRALDKLTSTLTKHEERHYSKVEAAKDLAIRDKQIEAVFAKVDKIDDKLSHIMEKMPS